jgi:hypothetical protein
MLTMARGVRMLGCACVLVAGCTGDDGDGMGDTHGADETSATTGMQSSGAMTMSGEETVDPPTTGEAESGTTDPSTSSGGESTDDGGSETGVDVEFDEEFMWVADFLRTNCVTCHATNMNGSLVLPSVDMSNEEVRLALEGVVANTGRLLVEPFDRQTSQTYLQITNEFGAQFPVEETDRFGAWIDAGASYLAK